MHFSPILPIFYRNEDIFPKGSRLLLLARSFFGALNNMITYFSLKHLPLPDVDMICAAGAVFACVPSRIFLKVQTSTNLLFSQTRKTRIMSKLSHGIIKG